MPDHTFGERLSRAFATRGHVCLGIDPHPYLLGEWGLDDTADGLREFGVRAIEAASGVVGIVKPQVAFFERHGAAGYSALEAVLARARDADLVIIADVKRGDVGSTLDAYAHAWLAPGSPLEVDAMTANPFQGVGSLHSAVELCRTANKGLFVLAATSNPESFAPQSAVVGEGAGRGATLAAGIVDDVIDLNSAVSSLPPSGMGSVGVVIGATVDPRHYGISLERLASIPTTPILAPGFGHQGASFSDLRSTFGSASAGVIATTSRGVLSAGRQGVAGALLRTAEELASCLA